MVCTDLSSVPQELVLDYYLQGSHKAMVLTIQAVTETFNPSRVDIQQVQEPPAWVDFELTNAGYAPSQPSFDPTFRTISTNLRPKINPRLQYRLIVPSQYVPDHILKPAKVIWSRKGSEERDITFLELARETHALQKSQRSKPQSRSSF